MSYKSNFVEANPHLVYSDEVDTAYDPTDGGGGGEEYDITWKSSGTSQYGEVAFYKIGFPIVGVPTGGPITKAKAGETIAVIAAPTNPAYALNTQALVCPSDYTPDFDNYYMGGCIEVLDVEFDEDQNIKGFVFTMLDENTDFYASFYMPI